MSDLRSGPAPTSSHLPAPAVFLGGLASEVNEPDELAPAFATIADVTERIVAAVRAGSLVDTDAAQYLQALRLTDGDGVPWTVGATSLRWYRKGPRGWKLAVPPTEAEEAHERALADALGAVPAEVLKQLGGVGASGDEGLSYSADPFAAAAQVAVQPWEYEPGDENRHAY